MCKSQKKPKVLGFTKIGITALTVFYILLISLSGCNNATPTGNGGGTIDPPPPPPPPPDNPTITYTINDPAYTSTLDSVISSNPPERAYPFDQWGYALSYSAYRDGQSPGGANQPTEEQITEDLKIISKKFKLIRMYNLEPPTINALSVISKSTDPDIKAIKVVLGAWIAAEVSNPSNPWGGGVFSKDTLALHIAQNCTEVNKAIELANQYPTIVVAVSVGNEALADWTDHLSTEESIIRHVVYVRKNIQQPVTVADNYVPWANRLTDLGNVVDFITIHTYPLWEKITVTNALTYTKSNYDGVQTKHPSKKIVIGECGWATKSDGKDIPKEYANEPNQKTYFTELNSWAKDNNIAAFFFQAFDENWKGDLNNQLDPEKHWGLFTSDRKAKIAMQDSSWYPELAPKPPSKIEPSFYLIYSDSAFTDSKIIQNSKWNPWEVTFTYTWLTTDVYEGDSAISILSTGSKEWGAGMGTELKADEHIDLSAFSNGHLHLSIRTNCTDTFKVGFQHGIYPNETNNSVKLESGKYGYENNGKWNSIVIPVADLVGTNGNKMLTDISSPFIIHVEKNPTDLANSIDIDNIYYSKQ